MGQTKIAIIGGDSRELYLANYLANHGYEISLCGFEKAEQLPALNYIDPLRAVVGTQAVILPLAGVKEDLTPNCPFSDKPPQVAERLFSALPMGLPVFIGWARENLRDLAKFVQLVEVAGDDELAILNSIPTAEGAIAIAMDQSDITIHGSNSLVIGFGRCGLSLARMLQGMGARVTVAARKAADLARAYEMGFESCQVQELAGQIEVMEFIFNTVPGTSVLPEHVLQQAGNCQIIVDIASGKGGTDFDSAARLKIKAILAPGLPGKIAPVTAGKILTRVYPRFFRQYGVIRR